MAFEKVVCSEVEDTEEEDATVCATRMRVVSRRINPPIIVVRVGYVGYYK